MLLQKQQQQQQKNRFINYLNILVIKGDQYAAKAIKKCFQR